MDTRSEDDKNIEIKESVDSGIRASAGRELTILMTQGKLKLKRTSLIKETFKHFSYNLCNLQLT